MDLTAVSDFIADTHCLESVSDVHYALDEFLKRRGFHNFACCSHVDFAHQPPGSIVMQNYPDEWAWYFREHGLTRYDPVITHCRRSLTGFNWSDPGLIQNLTQKEAEVLSRGAKFGIKLGHTIPFRYAGHFPASLSVVGKPEAMEHENIYTVQLIAPFLYQKLYEIERSAHGLQRNPHANLSQLEYGCLVLAAQGKSDWTIARISGVSTHSVAHALKRVRQKFGVSSRIQAVVHALHKGYLDFSDIIKK